VYPPAQNFRFAFRQMRQAPGFALIAVLTLALGIGATTAIFSLVEGILLRPLPFSNPDRLVLLGDHLGAGPNTPVTAREIGTYSKATGAFPLSVATRAPTMSSPAALSRSKSTLPGSLPAFFPPSEFKPSWAASLLNRKKTPTSYSPCSAMPFG
jgi:hypothetical protein